MEKIILKVFLMGGFLCGTAHAQSITNPEAVELALHKLEKLISTKVVDESFQKKLSRVTVSYSNIKDSEGFTINLIQHPGADNTEKSIELLHGPNGKYKSHTVKSGTESLQVPSWPEKDPISLAQQPMHFLNDSDNAPELLPFVEGMTEMILSQELDETGKMVAVFILKSSQESQQLHLIYKTNGTFVSFTVK